MPEITVKPIVVKGYLVRILPGTMKLLPFGKLNRRAPSSICLETMPMIISPICALSSTTPASIAL